VFGEDTRAERCAKNVARLAMAYPVDHAALLDAARELAGAIEQRRREDDRSTRTGEGECLVCTHGPWIDSTGQAFMYCRGYVVRGVCTGKRKDRDHG
jgi:hypothetical protein